MKVHAELKHVVCTPFEVEVRGGLLRGTARHIDKMYFGHTWALLFVEGGSIQHIIGPAYLFVDGARSKPYDPRPHMDNVLLASIHEAPKNFGLLEAFAAIRQRFC